MKIGFCTEHDLLNPYLRSGVPYHIAHAMNLAGSAVEDIRVYDRRNFVARVQSRFMQLFSRLLYKKHYNAYFSIAASRAAARQLDAVVLSELDFVFAINPQFVAYLKSNKPIILWVDNSFLTFTLYPGVENLSDATYREALQIEKLAFQNCSHLFVTSSWLKDELCKQYSFLNSKISVLPRGANISERLSKKIIEEQVELKIRKPLQLLHINSGWWQRKGGDLTVEIWEELKKNINVGLTIVGDIPPNKKSSLVEKGALVIGKIDKNSPEGFAHFTKTMASTHFLIVPSLADGFGIVYAEAASFGIPSVAFGIMGVTEAIKQDITGIHLPQTAGVEKFAHSILKLWEDKRLYKTLCLSSYDYAAEKFDWEKNIKLILEKAMVLYEGKGN